MIAQFEVNAAVTRLIQDSQLPKRQGGLGPFQRKAVTRERAERAVIAVEKTADGRALRGLNSSSDDPAFELQALQVAKDAEPKGFIFSSLLAWLIPIVIEWLVKRWIKKRLQT